MSTVAPLPADVVKAFPEVYGHTIKKEKKEKVTIKGIEIEIKRYSTTLKTSGIRVSLIDNSGAFFIKFNEYIANVENQRPADEKAMGMWSFTTLSALDPGLEEVEGAGYYVYQNNIIFNEEEKSGAPLARLMLFIEYYKKKFNIRTFIKEDEFSELDKLERE